MLAVLCFQAACVFHTADENTCTVIKVTDGDTFTCRMKNQQTQRIRMSGIDAPEITQPHGKNARDALHQAIFGKKVRLLNLSQDRYGRTLATVYINNQDQNWHMIQNGDAWVYRRYNRDPRYIQAEQTARQQRLGLWQDDNPTYPEDYRRQKKAR